MSSNAGVTAHCETQFFGNISLFTNKNVILIEGYLCLCLRYNVISKLFNQQFHIVWRRCRDARDMRHVDEKFKATEHGHISKAGVFRTVKSLSSVFHLFE